MSADPNSVFLVYDDSFPRELYYETPYGWYNANTLRKLDLGQLYQTQPVTIDAPAGHPVNPQRVVTLQQLLNVENISQPVFVKTTNSWTILFSIDNTVNSLYPIPRDGIMDIRQFNIPNPTSILPEVNVLQALNLPPFNEDIFEDLVYLSNNQLPLLQLSRADIILSEERRPVSPSPYAVSPLPGLHPSLLEQASLTPPATPPRAGSRERGPPPIARPIRHISETGSPVSSPYGSFLLSRQPPSGIRREGALRMGEMERNIYPLSPPRSPPEPVPRTLVDQNFENLKNSYETLLRRLYGLPVELPSSLLVGNVSASVISFDQATVMLSSGKIARFLVDPMLQPWAGPPSSPNRILSFYGNDGLIYLAKGRYNPATNSIFPPQ